jgi:hypothetical protein
MRFLADECCDAPLVDALRRDGHDVLYALEQLRGAIDEELLKLCPFGTAAPPDRGQRLWNTGLPLKATNARYHSSPL